MSLSPSLAPQALTLAAKEATKGRDTNLYRNIYAAYERAHAEAPEEVPELSAVPPLDMKWVDETNAKNQAERTKLEVELKTYTSNMIKESIRVCTFALLVCVCIT